VFVFDDGSTDNTRAVVESFGKSVRYFYQSHSGSPAVPRNRGIQESRKAYVAFLDADDAWYPNKLAEVAHAIGQHPEAGLFYSDFAVLDEKLSLMYIARCKHIVGNAYKQLLLRNPIGTSTAVVKRDAFACCGLFCEQLAPCEDWDMWIRISRQFDVVHVPIPLVDYTLHRNSTSGLNSERWFVSHAAMVERILSADMNFAEYEKTQIRAWQQYVTGRMRLSRGQFEQAVLGFQRSVSENILMWRSWLFLALLRTNMVWFLPRPWQRRLGIGLK
jgi:glycosyltransferase involved in cell wall biosynthesis